MLNQNKSIVQKNEPTDRTRKYSRSGYLEGNKALNPTVNNSRSSKTVYMGTVNNVRADKPNRLVDGVGIGLGATGTVLGAAALMRGNKPNTVTYVRNIHNSRVTPPKPPKPPSKGKVPKKPSIYPDGLIRPDMQGFKRLDE